MRPAYTLIISATRAGIGRSAVAIRGVDTTSRLTNGSAFAPAAAPAADRAIDGTSTFDRPIATSRVMRHERYRAGRSTTYSTVRMDRGSPGAPAPPPPGATDDRTSVPFATI